MDNMQQRSDSGEKGKQKESILSYLAQKNGHEPQELKKEIISYKNEIEVLKTEIELLEKEENQTGFFMDFAQNQSMKVAENIESLMEQEIEQIENESKNISEKHKQKIEELDIKMQQGIQYAYKTMNEMTGKQNQEDAPDAPICYTNVKKEKEPADVKIIEGFWEEPKTEEAPVQKVKAPVQDNASVLKNMYVIGKIAGEDLFDKSGKLIVAKNETIIQEVIDKAEREGKLIELVLEMKLQEG